MIVILSVSLYVLSTNQWAVFSMYVWFMGQGRCFAVANAVVVFVVIILSSRSEHWLNNFRLLTKDDDYPFFSSLTTTRSWLSYVLFASLSFSCRSSFFILSFSVLLRLITIAVFIHSLDLPPARFCWNIKTSSSLSLSPSSSFFRRPFKNLRESTDNKVS